MHDERTRYRLVIWLELLGTRLVGDCARWHMWSDEACLLYLVWLSMALADPWPCFSFF